MKSPTHLQELEGDEAEAFLLEAFDDVTDEPSLNSIRFDGNEGALNLGSHDTAHTKFKNH